MLGAIHMVNDVIQLMLSATHPLPLPLVIGLLASVFSAIGVFAQEPVPGRNWLIGGIVFGLSFGMAGLAGIHQRFVWTGFLPSPGRFLR